MEMTNNKDERKKQREILKRIYPDYYAPRHDAFVLRFNDKIEAEKLQEYMKNRGLN